MKLLLQNENTEKETMESDSLAYWKKKWLKIIVVVAVELKEREHEIDKKGKKHFLL